jgi:Fungal hydrophobin
MDILSILEGTDTESIMGTDCSPYDGDIGCDAQPLCCNNNEFVRAFTLPFFIY